MIHHKHHTQVATHAIDILNLVKHPAFPRAYSEILIPWQMRIAVGRGR